MIRNYLPSDEHSLLELWNTAGLQLGFAPLKQETFHCLLTGHPNFSPEYTFVLEEAGRVLGFVNGCTGADIPKGDVRGYVSCLILAPEADNDENTARLLEALEDAFRRAGRRYSAVTFFNPIRLPWIIPGTPGHQHNNAPGIALDIPLHDRMIAQGYQETTRECAMYLNLADFETPAWVEEKAEKMAAQGYHVARYDAARHTGLEEMVAALENPMWSSEIPAAGKANMDLLVGLKDNTCAAPSTRRKPAGAILRVWALRPSIRGTGWGRCCSTACWCGKSRWGPNTCPCSPGRITMHDISIWARGSASCGPSVC